MRIRRTRKETTWGLSRFSRSENGTVPFRIPEDIPLRVLTARRPRRGRRAFSLLEVILALAILAGSLAVLGEAIRLGMRNAEIVRDTTQAQLLCESKLAEIAAGLTPADVVQDAPFDCVVGDGQTIWLYSISAELTDEEGLQLVCVTVTQDLPLEQEPVAFSLFRWVPDASMQALAETEAASLDMGGTGE